MLGESVDARGPREAVDPGGRIAALGDRLNQRLAEHQVGKKTAADACRALLCDVGICRQVRLHRALGHAELAQHERLRDPAHLLRGIRKDHREFVVGRTDHKRFVGTDALGERLRGLSRDQLAIDDGAEREAVRDHAAERFGGHLGCGGLGIEDLLLAERSESGACRHDAERRGKIAAKLLGAGERDICGGPRDRVHTAEEVLCRLHAEQRLHRTAASGLAGDRDACGVATERSDVLLHPLERKHPVTHAAIRRRIFDPAKAVEPEPVRDGDGHDAVAVEPSPVVPGARGGAREVAAAVNPHKHWQAGAGCGRRGCGREDVDVERRRARHAGLGDEGHARVAALRGGAELERVEHALPGRLRHRGGKAKVADRRFGKWQAEKGSGCLGTAGFSAPGAAHAARQGLNLYECGGGGF